MRSELSTNSSREGRFSVLISKGSMNGDVLGGPVASSIHISREGYFSSSENVERIKLRIADDAV